MYPYLEKQCSSRRSALVGAVVLAAGLGAGGSGAEEPRGEAERRSLLESLLGTRPQADADPLLRVDLEGGVAVAYFVGHVEWEYAYRGATVDVRADRLWVEVRWPRGEGPGSGSKSKGTEAEGGAKDGRGSGAAADAFDLSSVRDFRLLAEGNVRVEVRGRDTSFEAESFFYENLTGRGVARKVRLRTTYVAARGVFDLLASKNYLPPRTDRAEDEGPYRTAPLSIRADLLRMRGFEWFGGEGVEVSTCDYGVPHYAVRAERVEVVPAPGKLPGGRAADEAVSRPEKAAPSRRASEGRLEEIAPAFSEAEGLFDTDWTVSLESAWVKLYDRPIVPVPVARWDTRWQTHIPIRSVDFGSSSQFGLFGGVEWNVNYLLRSLGPERFVPVSVEAADARLGFETTYLEKRGFGWGPSALYGTPPTRWEPWQLQWNAWTHYGEAQYWAIHDLGDEDRTTGLPIPEEDRYWGHAWHRQSVPHLGLLDLEVSKLSDRAFLGEYFESVAKDEKDPETFAYLRRNLFDNLALTGLYEVRANDFQSATERRPEGKALLLQQPVFSTGLYATAKLQAAYLRRLEDDALAIPPRDYGRFDASSEWSYPIGIPPYVQLRPFALASYTFYGEVLDPARGSEDRAAFGAGITASQEWSRVYAFDPGSIPRDALGLSTIRHAVVPEVTYLNLFSRSLRPEEIIAADETDRLDVEQSIALTLRNEILTRDPVPPRSAPVSPTLRNRDRLLEASAFRTRPLLQSSVSFLVYPDADRDNDGDPVSLLILDNTLYLHRQLSVRGWFELDPEESLRPERVDASVSYEAIPRRLWLSAGDRYTRDGSQFLYGAVSWALTDKWNVDAYYAHDFETGRDVEYSVSLSRVFHRFVLSVDFSIDVGEDRNKSVYLKFVPVELWRPARHRGVRRY